MPDQPVVVESTPTEVEDVFGGRNVSLDEFSRYRKGEIPAKTDTPEETVATEAKEPELEPESDPDETQEPPQKGSGAEKRIKQLLAEKKELQRKLEAKQDVIPESSPAPEPQHTRPRPQPADKNSDGTDRFAEYDEYIEELADWKAEQRMETAKREQVQQEAQKALQSKVDEARSRYDDADDVIFPTAQTIQNAKIPIVVKEVFGQSDLFVDLCYMVGSDPEELKKFISLAQTDPRAAIGKVFEYERGIKDAKPRDDKGKFTSKSEEDKPAPEAKKTSAPRPPSPVGGASSRAFDVSDESLSPEEWARKRTSDIQKRRA